MKRLEYAKRKTCAGCGITFVGGPIGEGAARVAQLAKRGIEAVDLGDMFVYGKTYCPRCGTNVWDMIEREWAETCRKCGKTFENEYEHLRVTSYWNKAKQRYTWQCESCSRPQR